MLFTDTIHGIDLHNPLVPRTINRNSTIDYKDRQMSDKCDNTCQVSFETTEQQLNKEKTLAAQAKALSHPARIRILHILHKLDTMDNCLNSDLVSELGLAQSTVSEHLRILKQAGFITAEPNPPKVCYRIQRKALDSFNSEFSNLFN